MTGEGHFSRNEDDVAEQEGAGTQVPRGWERQSPRDRSPAPARFFRLSRHTPARGRLIANVATL
jgi:hypothetical protein